MTDNKKFQEVLNFSAEKYARQYMEAFPQEFAFEDDGSIYWLGSNN